jgi:hypothetical protein
MAFFPSIHDLDKMSEQEFDREYARIEHHVARDNYEALRLLEHINAIIEEAGTFDLGYANPCPYDHAHTRHWCGNARCRDA